MKPDTSTDILTIASTTTLQEAVMDTKETVKTGITFGSALAMIISYTNWHSVFWAIIHGLLSWVYVIYYVIRY